MRKFTINGINYYFYGSHYIIYNGVIFNFKTVAEFRPLAKLLFQSPDRVHHLRLLITNTGEVEYVDPGQKPYLIGYKINENSIASQAEIKLTKIDGGGNGGNDGGENSGNGSNGGNGGNGGGGNEIVSKIAKAGFPLLIVLAIVGIGFTVFIKSRKK